MEPKLISLDFSHTFTAKKKETNKQVGRWCKQPVADQKQCERNSIEFFFFSLVVSQKCYDKCWDAMHARVLFWDRLVKLGLKLFSVLKRKHCHSRGPCDYCERSESK